MKAEEVYVGAKLYCNFSGDTAWSSHYIVGNVYEISHVSGNGVLLVASEVGYDLAHGRMPANANYPSFIPLDRLTGEERFLFEMTGKFPERLL